MNSRNNSHLHPLAPGSDHILKIFLADGTNSEMNFSVLLGGKITVADKEGDEIPARHGGTLGKGQIYVSLHGVAGNLLWSFVVGNVVDYTITEVIA